MKKTIETTIEQLKQRRQFLWINEEYQQDFKMDTLPVNEKQVQEAEARLERFAPLIMEMFPETVKYNGLIESPLTRIEKLQDKINLSDDCGRLYLKQDNLLEIAGSIKARGGIYEVLKHAEDLAVNRKGFNVNMPYTILGNQEYQEFFSNYKIQVGSTGNLGLSIGIMSAKLGFRVYVHMSNDAKEWKKELLRSHGVQVIEYAGDYGEAVKRGRLQSDQDPFSYFVDDESSLDLFVGYAVAAKRLKKQLDEEGIVIDRQHPLFIYIPCGVGGAPGGICYGLKLLYGENVNVFLIEPIESPCMILGISSGKYDQISVQEIGLTGKTEADGLAVGVASGLVARTIEHLLSGGMTLPDQDLYRFMKWFYDTEGIFLEPSAASCLVGPILLTENQEGKEYCNKYYQKDELAQATHILWATGGSLVPKDVKHEYFKIAEGMEQAKN
ncbi:MAG: D-serine ammonia-lyase [Tissierellia bacterium]|nr:D-serine ammonia-lyase [Tissierellia bacterium]